MSKEFPVSAKLGNAIVLNIKQFTSSRDLMRQGDYCGTISWSNGCKIEFRWVFSENGIKLSLKYHRTDRYGGSELIRQDIDILGLPSNLGRGQVIYFVCPFTLRLCRSLYLAFDSKYFRHRKAYRGLNYRTQKRSRRQRVLYRYWDLEELIDKLESSNCRKVYKGQRTRLDQRIRKLKHVKQEYKVRKMMMFFALMNRTFSP